MYFERPRSPVVAVYEWRAWEDFLVAALLPAAQRIGVRIGEEADAVLGQLDADVSTFIFHIDLTDSARVPLDRAGLVAGLNRRGIATVNAGLVDISKRRVQAVCAALNIPTAVASATGEPDERLIVKTDQNHGGLSEGQLDAGERRILGLRHTGPSEGRPRYHVVARRDIPSEIWQDHGQVVERFIENRRELIFRAHVLLDRLVISACRDGATIKRLAWGRPRREFHYLGGAPVPGLIDDEVLEVRIPPQLPGLIWSFCRAIGMQYGAIDVAMDDDEVCYVIDANGTPYWGRPDLDHIVAFLAGALPCSGGPGASDRGKG